MKGKIAQREERRQEVWRGKRNRRGKICLEENGGKETEQHEMGQVEICQGPVRLSGLKVCRQFSDSGGLRMDQNWPENL